MLFTFAGHDNALVSGVMRSVVDVARTHGVPCEPFTLHSWVSARTTSSFDSEALVRSTERVALVNIAGAVKPLALMLSGQVSSLDVQRVVIAPLGSWLTGAAERLVVAEPTTWLVVVDSGLRDLPLRPPSQARHTLLTRARSDGRFAEAAYWLLSPVLGSAHRFEVRTRSRFGQEVDSLWSSAARAHTRADWLRSTSSVSTQVVDHQTAQTMTSLFDGLLTDAEVLRRKVVRSVH